jgi:hypothetical protein
MVQYTIQNRTYVLLRATEIEEFNERMSRRLWYEVIKDEELLEFDF